MELIEVSGYITEEKIEIARKHLLPKELEANGLKMCIRDRSFAVFCFQSRNLKNKSHMKTRKQKETNEKEIHLLEQKGYERMMNEICLLYTSRCV